MLWVIAFARIFPRTALGSYQDDALFSIFAIEGDTGCSFQYIDGFDLSGLNEGIDAFGSHPADFFAIDDDDRLGRIPFYPHDGSPELLVPRYAVDVHLDARADHQFTPIFIRCIFHVCIVEQQHSVFPIFSVASYGLHIIL